ncbi:MAG: DMT family transporter [Patescibacteria group bacterium]|mgnify:CR=1 FL=1
MKRVFILLLLLALIGGGIGVFSKIALREIPPFSFTALRFFLATLVLLVWNFRSRSDRPATYPRAAYTIPLFLTGNIVLFAFGIRWTGATTSQIMYTAAPIIIALFSWRLLHQRITGRVACGILIGLTGVLIAMVPGGTGTTVSIFGPILIGGAIISFALYSVFSKQYLNHIAPQDIIFIFSWMTTLVSAVLAISDFWRYPHWWDQVSFEAIAWLFVVGILGTALFYVLHQFIVQKASPTVASMMLMLQPAMTFLWASLLLGERMTLALFLGMILTIFGAWLVTLDSRSFLAILAKLKKP